MKKAIIAGLLMIAGLACRKDAPAPTCTSCPYTFVNVTPYQVDLYLDGSLRYVLDSGQRWDTELSGEVLVLGDIQTAFAHTDYKRSHTCPSTCAHTLVIIQM